MLIGFYTRTSTLINWWLTISLQQRNVLVGHAGDILHRMLLLFAIFVPLGEHWSIDAKIEELNTGKKKKPREIVNGGTVALLLQLSFMYSFSGIQILFITLFFSSSSLLILQALQKTGDEWRVTGHATYYALQLDYFRTPIGGIKRAGLVSKRALKIGRPGYRITKQR